MEETNGQTEQENGGNLADQSSDAPPDTRHGSVLTVNVPDSNPYGKLFTGIAFKIAEGRQAYERRDGSKSRKVGTCAILLAGGFATLSGSINAILPKGAKAVQIDVNTMANGQTFVNALVPVDAESRAHFQQWRRAAGEAAARWLEAQGWGKSTAKAPETSVETKIGASYFD